MAVTLNSNIDNDNEISINMTLSTLTLSPTKKPFPSLFFDRIVYNDSNTLHYTQ